MSIEPTKQPSLRHRLLLITTGGTIAGKVAQDETDKQAAKGPEDFKNLLAPAVNFLREKSGIEIEIETKEIANVDSSNILPAHWQELATHIKNRFADFESFVITHGTNTLGYTCAALSFALANSAKPIVLTGSQVQAGLPGSDALLNLENAIRVATWNFARWNKSETKIKGILAVFGSHIITGTRVKKDTEFDYDAFKSFSTGSIGRIGRIIDLNKVNLDKHNSYLKAKIVGEAWKGENLICEPNFDLDIASLTEFPGMSTDLIKSLVERNGIKGFIFRAFGAGDPSDRHLPTFRYLKDRGIPIVVTTQAPNGNANLRVNEPGQHLLAESLAIPAYDMSIEAQTTKLAWLLFKKSKGEITYETLCTRMLEDMRGEITAGGEDDDQ
jgi:L-asparaginase